MRILLDHCIDWRLKQSLPKHKVNSAQEMGWEGLKNRKLLSTAATGFDVMITVDQSIKHQQNIDRLPIAVLALIAHSNRLEDVKRLIPTIEACLPNLKKGSLVQIDAALNAVVIAPGR
jgi:hypothetical protein